MGESIEEQWRIVLPSAWWTIPLRDERARERSAEALVRAQFKGTPAPQSLIRDMISAVSFQALRAAEANGVSMAIARELLPGIPLGASLIVTHTPTPPITAEDLQMLLTPGSDGVLEAAEVAAGDAVRRVVVARVEAGDELTSTTLTVDHFVPDERGFGYYGVVLSAPLPEELLAPVIELFDSIAQTFHYRSQEDEQALGEATA